MWTALIILSINIIFITIFWYINSVIDNTSKNVLLGLLLSLNIIGIIIVLSTQQMYVGPAPVPIPVPQEPPSVTGIIGDVIAGKPIDGGDITSVLIDQVKSNPKILGELVKLIK
jgi:hypothetical protein